MKSLWLFVQSNRSKRSNLLLIDLSLFDQKQNPLLGLSQAVSIPIAVEWIIEHWRNFLHYLIHPFQVLFITLKKYFVYWYWTIGYFSIMSKLNNLHNAQKNTLCYQIHQKWGDNVLIACPSILQWSLNEVRIRFPLPPLASNFRRCRSQSENIQLVIGIRCSLLKGSVVVAANT